MASAQVAAAPTASTAMWLPPPVRSCTWVATSTRGEHGVLRAQAARQGQRRRGAVDRDYVGTERDGDLHGAEAHAADPDHRDPLAGLDARAGAQCAVGGGEPAAQSGRRGIANGFGDRDQVGVSRMQGHILGERPPVGETRLSLVRTYLGLTVQAPLAPATAAHERCGDPVPDRPSTYVGAHGGDYADQLVAWNVREMYPVVVPGPCMPVTATKAGTAHSTTTPPGDGAGSATDQTSTGPPNSSKTTARMVLSLLADPQRPRFESQLLFGEHRDGSCSVITAMVRVTSTRSSSPARSTSAG